MNPRRKLEYGLVIALLATAGGCLGRTFPIPPPGAQFSATSECALSDCPNGGVIVTVEGIGQVGALIVVENTSAASRGHRYVASAFGATSADVAAGRARDPGGYVIRLGPVPERPDRPSPVLISQHGDRITVYQFVIGQDGFSWVQSLPSEPQLVVP